MLLKLLSARGDSAKDTVVVVLADAGTVGPRIAALGVPVFSLNIRRDRPNPFIIVSLIRLLRRFKPDIVQGWLIHGNLIASLASLLAGRRGPVLWNVRQSLDGITTESRLTTFLLRLSALFSCHADAIIYNSLCGAAQHEALGYCAARRVFIPNGFDCERFFPSSEKRRAARAELGVADDAILIGLIGRFHPIKGHRIFFQAAALVARRDRLARFVLVGKGMTRDEPALLALLGEHDLGDRMFFLGERPDIPVLTAALDIACSSSLGEAFSNTIGEAMASGIPCVVTDVGDSAVIVDGSGIVVPPNDPEAFARGIGELIEAGAEKRQALGAAARARILDNFALGDIARRYDDLYRRYLAAAR